MQYAYQKSGKKPQRDAEGNACWDEVVMDESERFLPFKAGKGFCFGCDQPVIAKCGEVNIHHWAHENLGECDGMKEETYWHKTWKECFGEKYREVVIKKDGGKRIADVLIGNRVFEFESRRIELVDLRIRTNFWLSCGYVPLWIFKCGDEGSNHYILDDFFNGNFNVNIVPRYEETRTRGIYWFKNGFKRLIGFRTPFVIDFSGVLMRIESYWYFEEKGRVYFRGKVVEISEIIGAEQMMRIGLAMP